MVREASDTVIMNSAAEASVMAIAILAATVDTDKYRSPFEGSRRFRWENSCFEINQH